MARFQDNATITNTGRQLTNKSENYERMDPSLALRIRDGNRDLGRINGLIWTNLALRECKVGFSGRQPEGSRGFWIHNHMKNNNYQFMRADNYH